ncbi:hypothetical protein Tco_0748427 [Tanacetum coccineum]|uniref:Uncharacterized protein n=1 Tax=Tanacetum coccineum TaxID=301880 RepID=A0ABQ4YY44_9ASTR
MHHLSLVPELDSLEEENEDQEEKEFNLEDIFQIQDVYFVEKLLLNVPRLFQSIESLKDKPTPDRISSDYTEETRSGSTTTHANYSLPEYDSFLFEIEPDQEMLISINNLNNTLLELSRVLESYPFTPHFLDLLLKPTSDV